MVIEGNNVIEYTHFASRYKRRNGFYPLPFKEFVQSHLSLEIRGEALRAVEAEYFLFTGIPWDGVWKKVTYFIPKDAQESVFEDFSILANRYEFREISKTGLRRRGMRIDVIGTHTGEKGTATLRLTVPGKGRVNKVELRYKKDYT